MNWISFYRVKKRHFFYVPLSFLLVIVVSASSFLLSGPQTVDAQVVNFYATNCVGGWDGSEQASGESQVKGDLLDYSLENSAYLENKISPLSCSGYTGNLPPETYHTRVMVRFSWSQSEPALPTQSLDEVVDTEAQGDLPADVSNTPEEVFLPSSIVEILTEETGESASSSVESDGPPDVPVDSEPEKENLEADSEVEHASDITQDPEAEEVIAPEVAEEVIVPEIEEEVVVPEVESSPAPASEPVSWLRNLILPLVYAEELEDSVDLVSTTTFETAISETVIPEIDNVQTDQLVATGSVDSVIGNLENATSDNLENATTTAGAQFMVRYSFDGQSWLLLGYITTINNDVRIEFPKEVFPTLTDISKLHIELTPLLQLNNVSPIFLDSMWLELSYAPLGELGVHTISPIIPIVQPIKSFIVEEMPVNLESSSTTAPFITRENFVSSIVSVQGLDERYAAVAVASTSSSSELWLFDMEQYLVHKIGIVDAEIGKSLLPASKDKMIFWLNYTSEKLFTYDLRTAGILHEMLLVQNLPLESEYKFTFPFTDWEAILRGGRFYFFSRQSGEVFQDENTKAAILFFKYFKLTSALSYDQIQAIGGTFITPEEIIVAESAIIESE